jgi:hypothetical protein
LVSEATVFCDGVDISRQMRSYPGNDFAFEPLRDYEKSTPRPHVKARIKFDTCGASSNPTLTDRERRIERPIRAAPFYWR